MLVGKFSETATPATPTPTATPPPVATPRPEEAQAPEKPPAPPEDFDGGATVADQAVRSAIRHAKEAKAAQDANKEQALLQKKAAQDAKKAQALLQKNLDAYAAILKASDVTVVQNVTASQSDDTWTVKLTVSDIWHYKTYQVRLQDTQNLWKAWATIASPKDPDKARISIRDLNGNEVGGSRFLAGSLIWVQEK